MACPRPSLCLSSHQASSGTLPKVPPPYFTNMSLDSTPLPLSYLPQLGQSLPASTLLCQAYLLGLISTPRPGTLGPYPTGSTLPHGSGLHTAEPWNLSLKGHLAGKDNRPSGTLSTGCNGRPSEHRETLAGLTASSEEPPCPLTSQNLGTAHTTDSAPRHHPGTGQGLTFYLLRAGLGPEPRDLPRWVTCSHLLLTEAPRTASLAQRGPHDSARGHTPGNVLSSAATAAVGHHGWLCRRRAGAGARVCVGMNLGISGAGRGGLPHTKTLGSSLPANGLAFPCHL